MQEIKNLLGSLYKGDKAAAQVAFEKALGVKKEEAEEMLKQLTEAGATAELK